MENKYADQIDLFLQGRLNAAERAKLETELAADPNTASELEHLRRQQAVFAAARRKATFAQFDKWEKQGLAPQLPPPLPMPKAIQTDADLELETLLQNTLGQSALPPKPTVPGIPIWQAVVAAAFAALIGAVAAFQFLNEKNKELWRENAAKKIEIQTLQEALQQAQARAENAEQQLQTVRQVAEKLDKENKGLRIPKPPIATVPPIAVAPSKKKIMDLAQETGIAAIDPLLAPSRSSSTSDEAKKLAQAFDSRSFKAAALLLEGRPSLSEAQLFLRAQAYLFQGNTAKAERDFTALNKRENNGFKRESQWGLLLCYAIQGAEKKAEFEDMKARFKSDLSPSEQKDLDALESILKK